MEKIGKYKIDGLIGQGGFGRVYRAFDSTVNRTVAIKILRDEGQSDDGQLLTRFRAEAKTTGTLFHKNIVTIYEYGETEGVPYLVMEYLQGRDLEHLLEDQEPMSLVEKVSLMKQVSEGLQYAHSKGIIHRDVKPANIMVCSDGTVKLMDFGIARLARDASTRLTQHGQFMGTISYMAPEQFEGKDDYLSDIFAYGVIYYHLLTGQHPFGGKRETFAVLLRNITSVDPVPIRERLPDCPAALEQIIAKAIQKERDRRYQSFEDLQLDAAPILAQLEADLGAQKVSEGEALLVAGKIDEARNAVRDALRLAPGSPAADRLRRKIQQQIETRALQERCRPIRIRGDQEFEAGNYAKAIEAYTSVLRLDALDAEAAHRLEEARSALSHIDRANLLLEQAQRELTADNLSNADRFAELFFEEALHLLPGLKIVYPAASKVQELVLAMQSAHEANNRRERLKSELETADRQIREMKWSVAVATLQQLSVEYPLDMEVESRLDQAQDGLRAEERTRDVGRISSEARSLLERLQFEAADRLLADALRTYPGDTVLLKLQTESLKARHDQERRLAIANARSRVAELISAKRFSEASIEVERAVRTWEAPELHELLEKIEQNRVNFEREKTLERNRQNRIKTLQSDIDRLVSCSDFDDALRLLKDAAFEFPDVVLFTQRIGQVKTDVLYRIDQLRNRHEFIQALDLLSLLKRDQPDSSLDALESALQRERAKKERADAIKGILAESDQEKSKGRLERAISILERGSRDYPDEDQLQTALNRLTEEKANLRAAEIGAIAEEATAFLRSGDLERTVSVVKRGLEEFPEDPRLVDLRQQADAARREDERRKAVAAALNKAIEIQRSGRFMEAGPDLLNFLEENRQHPGVADQLDSLRRLINRAREIESAINQVTRLLNEGKLAESISVLKDVDRRFPGDPKTTALLRDVQERKSVADVESISERIERKRSAGELDEAARELEAGLTNYPGVPALLRLKSAVEADVKESGRLNEVARTAFEARRLIDLKDFTASNLLLREALVRFPNEPELKKLLALANEFEKERLESLNQFNKRATEAIGQKQFGDATQILRQGLQDFPGEQTLLDLCDRVETEQARIQEVERIALQARRLIDARGYTAARRLLKEKLARFPSEPELTKLLALVEKSEKEREASLNRFGTRATEAIGQKQFGDATQILRQGLEEFPGEKTLLDLLSRAETEEARLRRERTLQSRINEANSQAEKKLYEQAIQLLDNALVEFPGERLLSDRKKVLKSEFRVHEARQRKALVLEQKQQRKLSRSQTVVASSWKSPSRIALIAAGILLVIAIPFLPILTRYIVGGNGDEIAETPGPTPPIPIPPADDPSRGVTPGGGRGDGGMETNPIRDDRAARGSVTRGPGESSGPAGNRVTPSAPVAPEGGGSPSGGTVQNVPAPNPRDGTTPGQAGVRGATPGPPSTEERGANGGTPPAAGIVPPVPADPPRNVNTGGTNTNAGTPVVNVLPSPEDTRRGGEIGAAPPPPAPAGAATPGGANSSPKTLLTREQEDIRAVLNRFVDIFNRGNYKDFSTVIVDRNFEQRLTTTLNNAKQNGQRFEMSIECRPAEIKQENGEIRCSRRTTTYYNENSDGRRQANSDQEVTYVLSRQGGRWGIRSQK